MMLSMLRLWASWSFWFIITWGTCVLHICEYHFLVIHNTSLSLLVSVLRNFSFFSIMLKMTWKELSTIHHSCKVDLILLSDFSVMHCCSHYIVNGVDCVISDVSNSCTLCYQHNQSCNLAPPTLKLTCTLHEKEWVDSELLTAETKAIQLWKQKWLLQKWLHQLDDQEVKNIEELKKDKARAEAAALIKTPATPLFSEEELQAIWTPFWMKDLPVNDSFSWCIHIHQGFFQVPMCFLILSTLSILLNSVTCC